MTDIYCLSNSIGLKAAVAREVRGRLHCAQHASSVYLLLGVRATRNVFRNIPIKVSRLLCERIIECELAYNFCMKSI